MATAAAQRFAAIMLIAAAVPATGQACGLEVEDPLVQLAFPSAKSAAVYVRIKNPCRHEDRLTGIASEAAGMAELHMSKENDQGIVSMAPVEGGIAVPPFGEATLEPGGLHGMLMMLAFPEGSETLDLTLTFESAGELALTAPVRFRLR